MFPTADTEDIVQVTSLNRKPCVSSDVRDSTENTQLVKQQNNRELTLKMLIKEMVFCLALALTTYGALHNAPTKVSKHPQAVRFFSRESTVTDWYRGQLSRALSYVNSMDVSFVMYYAPWDAESQHVRGEFEKAAAVLGDRVHFSAINCWNPGSECRLQHSKIPSWPILMAYTVTSRGVLYKGPQDAHSMIKFLELIMKPLERISSTEDLVTLMSICDAVAVGYTPLTNTSKYYNTWYYVALKAREFDFMGELCFAVVTSLDLAVDLGIEGVPNVRLMLWNTTKEFVAKDDSRSWNETSLLQWLFENFSHPLMRVVPMWKKAFSFEHYADGNPIFLLFTPLNPLYEQLPSYGLLREVVMEYYNCKTNEGYQWISEMIKLHQIQRMLYQQRNYSKYCGEFMFRKPVQRSSFKKQIVSHNNKYPWYNATQKSQKMGAFDFLLRQGQVISKALDSADDESDVLSTIELLQHCDSKEMPAEKEFYDIYEQCEKYQQSLSPEYDSENEHLTDVETSMLPHENDALSSENLMLENAKHFCKLWKFANEIGKPVAPAKISRAENISYIEGLACVNHNNNFTLHFVAIDSVRNHHFAEFLGLDIINKKDMTSAVILDSKLETQYFLSEEYSAKSVRDFIYNFSHKKLKRSLRTHVENQHTHYFRSNSNLDPEKGTNYSTFEIIDLTSHTFRRIVRTPGTVSIVCVCGGSCAGGAAAAAAAARLLRASGVPAQAARLDARRHDLPWHYTVHYYPTIFVFAADGMREAESRAYPAGERVSASGLVALALRLLGPRRHLRVRLELCAATQLTNEKKTCLKDLREHVTTVIGRNLKYWRRSEHRELKDALFKRLQHLHQVSLDLSTLHITDLQGNSSKQKTLLNSLSLLSKNWNIDGSILGTNVSSSKS